MQAALLSRDVEASNELYKQVVKRLMTGGIFAGINGPDVTVIDPAAVPVQKAEPHAALNLLGGIVISSLFGLALCGLLEGSDTRIATMNVVAELCPLAGAGIIPRLTDKRVFGKSSSPGDTNKLKGLEALDRPESPTADAYRSLRTALIHAGSGVSPKVVLITSPLSREGKTAASANLAVVFAQMNRRVLLVDADLRRRSLSRTFNSPGTGGLSAALSGEDHRSYCLPQPQLPGLYVLPAGDGRFNPPDLFDSPRMRELVAQWSEEYDHVIVDAPQVIGPQ
ncbi:tyrosine-protein kinase domain-containing protein [Edaphobacter bradus]|uniref:tyrosine-protein kinase domain-containing protein n=1 Tax=Edaphobacter bradus TaxID=2259016 RepID=UPI0021DF9D7F|nr:tyrosine-protein kinase domain-containing protein [Edaphobacter bradus]